MSDPIRKILRNGGYSYGIDNKIKQIRQQIGRELLDEFKTRLRLKTYVPENIVREVCKLEDKQ